MLTYDMIKRESEKDFINRIYLSSKCMYALYNITDLKRFLSIFLDDIETHTRYFYFGGRYFFYITTYLDSNNFYTKQCFICKQNKIVLCKVNFMDISKEEAVELMLKTLLSLREKIERNDNDKNRK